MAILIPIDGSPRSNTAIEHVAKAHPESDLTLLHVIDPIEAGYSAEAFLPSYSEEWYENELAQADRLFSEAKELLANHGGAIDTETQVGRPARVIVDYADDQAIDHIIMGSHGRSGVARILLGSVAETVVRRSPVPVTVVR